MANNDDNIEFSDELPYSDEKVGNIDESQELSNFEVPEDFNKDKSLTEIATLSKWEKLKRKAKRTWHGKNDFGVVTGIAFDIGELFLPNYVAKIRDKLQSKTKQNTMTSEAESFLQKVKRFLKQKSTRRGAATIAALLGAIFGLDIQPELLIQSLTGIVTGATAIVAGFYSIKDIFTDEEN